MRQYIQFAYSRQPWKLLELHQEERRRSYKRRARHMRSYEGGMAWEGAEQYETLDDALHALERGIANFIEGFDTPHD